MNDISSQRPLAGDRPIDSPEQDTIGRSGFALQIRRDIETAPRDEGLVLAVTGEWGSGKTSVINLALRPLQERDGYRVVQFNPWLFSGTPQLMEHFFSELRAQLRASGNTRLKEIGEVLERYGEAIDPLRFLPGADKAAALTRSVGRVLRGPEHSVKQQREELDGLLANHDELLVIVVDDIDRLHDQEVADVMRLVRLVADFPNTVYVLAFDVNRVAAAVDRENFERGHEYIEKIVQVAYEVPAISGEQLSRMLLERIESTLQGIPYKLDLPHWTALYLTFKRYLTSPRDVSRYCNHIRSPIQLLASEIEAADVLALEALRLYERAFWTELPHLIPELTRSSDEPGIFSGGLVPDGERLKRLVDAGQKPAMLREVLQELFPAASKRLGSSLFGSSPRSTWRHERRVADPSVLQVYLSKQIQADEAPTAVVERVAGLLTDADALRAALDALRSPQLADLFGRLEDFEGKFPDDVAPAIPVFYATTERLLPRSGMFDAEPAVRVARVILRMLRGREQSAVFEIVVRAMGRLERLSDRWSLLELMSREGGEAEGLVSVSQANQLADELLSLIAQQSPRDLAIEPELPALLRLVESRQPGEGQALARSGAQDDLFMLRLLSTHIHEVRSERGRSVQLTWDTLADLLGEDLLAKRVGELPDPPTTANADTREMLAQARRYAADPRAAKHTLDEYRKRYPR